MRILITNTGPWGTGSFTVAQAVMEELIALGHEVKIFFPDTQLPTKELNYYYKRSKIFEIWKFPIQKDKVKLEYFPLIITDPHPRNPNGKTLLQITKKQKELYFNEFKVRIKKLIEKFKPDIIECQHIWAFDHIIHELGYPYICVAHHSDQLGFKYDHKMRPTALLGAKNAKYIFAISKFVKKEVISLYSKEKEKEKVIVLSNGYNKKVFRLLNLNRSKILKKYDLKIPKNAKIISFAGKISRTKGIDILLKANRLIQKKANVHFIILGSGNIEKTLKKNEKHLCSFENVHFLGHRPPKTLAEIHNISNFSVLPSRSEGFGIACLEAMACGLPVIVTNTGGLEEYAVGKIVKVNNHRALSKAILKLVELSSDDYKILSKEALDKAKEFSWPRITKKRLKYYEKVIEESKQGK